MDKGPTVADLTESSCRWPTGNPVILRRSGTAARPRTASRTANAMRVSPTCGDPPDGQLGHCERRGDLGRDEWRGDDGGPDHWKGLNKMELATVLACALGAALFFIPNAWLLRAAQRIAILALISAVAWYGWLEPKQKADHIAYLKSGIAEYEADWSKAKVRFVLNRRNQALTDVQR